MGMDWGDYDNDGQLDLFVATFSDEPKCVYHNVGGGVFKDSGHAGVWRGRRIPCCLRRKWLDYDNDGWLDLMLANGHVQDNIADFSTAEHYRQPTLLFHNDGGKHFVG